MSRSFEELVELFSEKDYLMKMGAGKLSKRYNTTESIIRAVKSTVKNKEKYGTTYNPKDVAFDTPSKPKGKLLKRWGKEGNWHESYKFEDDKEDELNNFKEVFFNELSNIKLNTSHKTNYSNKQNNELIEIGLPDYHFGKIDGLTIEEQASRFVRAGLELFNKAHTINTSHVLLPIGNDFFNSEVTSTTHKGTPQQNNAEFHKMFAIGWGAIIELINNLSTDITIDIIIVPGNHDTDATIMLGEVLTAYYHNDTHVNVNNGSDQVKYYKFGKNFFLYNHGDKIKGPDLALRMAVEKPLEFADSKYRFIKLGHFHKNIVLDETMGISVEYMPSLCSADAWHNNHNFLSQPKSYATVYNKLLGKSSVYTVYAENI